MKRETGLRTAIVAVILVLCAISLWPTVMVFSKSNDLSLPMDQREREIYKRENPKVASKSLNLGLDLAGGTHIIVEIDRSRLDEAAGHDVLDRSLEIIRNRVDQYGLSEPVITKSGDNRIIASLAGMGAEDARRLIGATALLEFKLVADPQEFRPVLDRIDAFLLARSRGRSPGEAADAPVARPRTEMERTFGRVVRDDTAAVIADGDTALAARTDTAAAADTAAGPDTFDLADGAFDPQARPFSSLLIQVGRDIAVSAENVDRMRRILADREVQQIIPPRYQFLWARSEETLQGGHKVRRLYFLKRRAEMTGSTIADATFQHAQGGLNAGELEVGLTFKGIGPKEFARVTGANVGNQLAIVLDSVVYSAPVIQGRIPNGRASITGVGSVTEAKQLAVVLRAGALPVPMNIVELRSVGPTLGEENIRRGMTAAVLSLVLIFLLVAVYYRTAGLIANVALILNMILTLAILSAFGATLTLPGIAGLALTMGMSIDANVLIMERIREELNAGRSLRAALDLGYQKAFRAIVDSNLTLMGTAAILYYVGVGPIRGFGLTLLIGVGSSMFTAVVVTRLIFDRMLRNPERRSIAIGRTLPFLKNIDLRVIPRARLYAGISIVALVVSAAALVVKGPTFGIDFTGGHVYQVQMPSRPDVDAIRADLSASGVPARVQTLGGTNANELLISAPVAGNDSILRARVLSALGEGAVLVGEETVGPTIGADLKKAALIAIFLSLALMVFYIWVRFGVNGLGFGVAAILALTHDAFVTLGIFTLMGWQINLNFVAAILTIIGYSVNDTIVVFDRVREVTHGGLVKGGFGNVVNQANNESFSRTITTSLLTLVAVAILVVYGGTSIRDLNIALMIGTIVGTYSTIALACPFVVWWNNRRIRVRT